MLYMAKTLGHEIQRVRQLRGLSLNAAAQPAGVSAAYLQKLERDQVESPSPHRLQRLADVLGVEYADLFTLAGYPLPQTSQPAGDQPDVEPASAVSALRRILLSEDEVSDEELEELLRYLKFMREQREAE
jgi:transcriptional regulator with XRE-family HTH domain